MIIRSLHLHPFAGIANQTYDFSPGLNVVLGPNEAGKSTLVRAIITTLFESTAYNKVHWRKVLEQFRPRPAGDTFRVRLELTTPDGDFSVQKSWGADTHSELILPTGQTLNQVSDVDQRLEDLLVLKQGTWRNILISRQAALSATLRDLDTSGDETADLAQLLRKTAFNTDGVSIEQLEQSIAASLEDTGQRWDSLAEGPENGRGINNPWKKGVGSLLKAWYVHQQLLAQRRDIEEYERRVDDTARLLGQLTDEEKVLSAFVTEYQPIVESAEKRRGLSSQLQLAKDREDRFRKIQTAWPEHEHRKKQLLKTIPTLEKSLVALRTERAAYHSYQKSASTRNKLEQFEKAELEKQTLESQLKKFGNVSAQTFEELENAITARDKLRASLKAGKLSLSFQSSVDLAVEVQNGVDEPYQDKAGRQQPLHLNAEGRVVLKTADWELQVESGDGSFTSSKQEYDATTDRIDELLKKVDADSAESARQRRFEFDAISREIDSQQKIIRQILGGQTIEELKAELGEDMAVPERTIDEIDENIRDREREHGQQQVELQQVSGEIEKWQAEFESEDAILDAILDARQNRKSLEKELEELPLLPAEVDDFDALIFDYRAKRARVTEIREQELPTVKTEQATLTATAPDNSTKEIDEAISDAEAAFLHERHRLRALERVSSVFQRLRAELDSGTLDPWTTRMSTTIHRLTSGRYKRVDVNQSVAERSAEFELPHELLSMGTRSSVGLAIRLSMAAHFMEGRNGFLVLDDPMVDLDSDRQERTAEILKEFAEKKQVIVLTCHPAHAHLLSDKPICLDRTT